MENNSLGASVEYNHLLAALYETLVESNRCEIIDNDPIRYISPSHSMNKMSIKSQTPDIPGLIELESGKKFKAKLIIGNDGEYSYTK